MLSRSVTLSLSVSFLFSYSTTLSILLFNICAISIIYSFVLLRCTLQANERLPTHCETYTSLCHVCSTSSDTLSSQSVKTISYEMQQVVKLPHSFFLRLGPFFFSVKEVLETQIMHCALAKIFMV